MVRRIELTTHTAMQTWPTRRNPSSIKRRCPLWNGWYRPTNRAVGAFGSKVGTRASQIRSPNGLASRRPWRASCTVLGL